MGQGSSNAEPAGLSAYAEQFEAFLAYERVRVSTQGYASIARRTRHVLAWLASEELSLGEVTLPLAIRFQAELSERPCASGERLATGTVINYVQAARRFYGFLVRSGVVATNPFALVRYPRESEHLSRNGLSEAQMGQLLKALHEYHEAESVTVRRKRYRVHVLAEFLYATGLRIAEAASLTPGNLDLGARLVYLPEGKGGKPRTAFLTRYAAEVLSVYLERGREAIEGRYGRGQSDRLFGADATRLAFVLNAELARVCTALELPVITSHGFRHSLGTHLLRAGCDMRHIQAILGHERLQTTQVYTRVDKDDLKRSLDAFHPRRWPDRRAASSRVTAV